MAARALGPGHRRYRPGAGLAPRLCADGERRLRPPHGPVRPEHCGHGGAVAGRRRARRGGLLPSQRARGPDREPATQPLGPDHPAPPGLKTEINAVAFFRSDQPGKRVAEDLFKQYARFGGNKFTWRVVDPDREPALARRYGVESYGTVVLETKTRSEKVTDAEEEKITNGLLKLTREGKRTVYVVQGHGERELTSTERAGFSEAKSAMEKVNYDVKPLMLARESKVPEDAAVVMIPGARTELFPPELEALDAYIARSGKLFVMADPTILTPGQDAAIKKFVSKYGMELGDNLVIELNPIGRLFGIGPEVPIIQQYEPHPITRDLAGISTLFPLTRTVTPAATPPTGMTDQVLARTTPDSWGETDRASLQAGQVKPDPQDPKRSEEHTSELQSRLHLVCRLLLEKKKQEPKYTTHVGGGDRGDAACQGPQAPAGGTRPRLAAITRRQLSSLFRTANESGPHRECGD